MQPLHKALQEFDVDDKLQLACVSKLLELKADVSAVDNNVSAGVRAGVCVCVSVSVYVCV